MAISIAIRVENREANGDHLKRWGQAELSLEKKNPATALSCRKIRGGWEEVLHL